MKKKCPYQLLRPGSQTRRFTHVYDTVNVCYEAWKNNKCAHYSMTHKQSFSVKEVAKMFNSAIIMVKPRSGERYASALTNMSLNNKVIRRYGKII